MSIDNSATQNRTVASRLTIGFPGDCMEWKISPAIYSRHALMICGHPVMEDWETPYMKRLAYLATSKKGIVLEVGFGMGISAGFINSSEIDKHIIIEVNRDVANRAREFAEQATHPTDVIEGLWQDVIGNIPDESLDGILFDTYPLSVEEIHKNAYPFFRTAFVKLKQGGIFTYYSDESSSYSFEHHNELIKVGFKKERIGAEIVHVNPPVHCKYWNSKTMLAPIITK